MHGDVYVRKRRHNKDTREKGMSGAKALSWKNLHCVFGDNWLEPGQMTGTIGNWGWKGSLESNREKLYVIILVLPSALGGGIEKFQKEWHRICALMLTVGSVGQALEEEGLESGRLIIYCTWVKWRKNSSGNLENVILKSSSRTVILRVWSCTSSICSLLKTKIRGTHSRLLASPPGDWSIWSLRVTNWSRGVQPAARGPQEAQHGYECCPTQNCKFT